MPPPLIMLYFLHHCTANMPVNEDSSKFFFPAGQTNTHSLLGWILANSVY